MTLRDYTPSYYVYMVECNDGSFYVGYTEDLAGRIVQHREGLGASYTKLHGFKRLIYFEKHSKKKWALFREKQIKTAGRDYKEVLIKEFHKDLILLK